MPNWCDNQLILVGPRADIDTFLGDTLVTGTDQYDIMGHLLPFPENLRSCLTVTHGDVTTTTSVLTEDGYQWQVDHWGCKWGDCDTTLTFVMDGPNGTSEAILRFDSPWSPPRKGIDTISALYPTLTFVLSYREDGLRFFGVATYRNGQDLFSQTVTNDDHPALATTDDREATVTEILATLTEVATDVAWGRVNRGMSL